MAYSCNPYRESPTRDLSTGIAAVGIVSLVAHLTSAARKSPTAAAPMEKPYWSCKRAPDQRGKVVVVAGRGARADAAG